MANNSMDNSRKEFVTASGRRFISDVQKDFHYTSFETKKILKEYSPESSSPALYKKTSVVNLEPHVTLNHDKLSINFNIYSGTTGHSYVLKDVAALLSAIDEREIVSYGKHLEFTHDLSAFSEESQKIISFLKDFFRGKQLGDAFSAYSSSAYSYGKGHNKELELTGHEIDEFFSAVSSIYFRVEFYSKLLTLHGSWARERWMDFREIGFGDTSIESFRGESSHQFQPFMALVQKEDSQDTGKVYGFSFVYSGNFEAGVTKSQFNSLRVYMGIGAKNFRWTLRPGEKFDAPEVVMTYSAGGLGKMTRTFHDLFRNHLIRSKYKDMERPILINNWEATYFDFDSDKLIAIAREAKKSGIEMLVMDDGWFGERNDDNSSLGDWYVNEDKLKGGLKKLVDEVNSLGMKFGIWMEPEMVSPRSKLFEAHPDWAIQIPRRTPCRSRNQLVLDITRQEVRDYIYGRIRAILTSANIEYVKWDMNRQLCDLGSLGLDKESQGELSHRYMLAVYELQERMITEFPDLLLENCSGGGARFDAGMLYYSPQIWCSDDTDAIERLVIQEGTSLIFPLSTMGAHVSDCPNHTVGRTTPFKTRGDVALAGTFGYELDITRIPEEDRADIPRQVAVYHKYNHLVRGGDYYRIASYQRNHEYDAYIVVSKDKKEALITYVQVVAKPNSSRKLLKVPGLLADVRYQLEGSDEEILGATLEKVGLSVNPLNGDYRSELIHLIARK